MCLTEEERGLLYAQEQGQKQKKYPEDVLDFEAGRLKPKSPLETAIDDAATKAQEFAEGDNYQAPPALGVSPSASVVTTTPQHMDWNGACDALLAGSKLRRESWEDRRVIIFIDEERLKIVNQDGLSPLCVHVNDMTGTDWVVAE